MDMLDRLDGAFTSTGRVIAKVTPDQMGAPTPCPEWDVRALLDHVTGVVTRFEATASRRDAGKSAQAGGPGADPSAAFDQAASSTLAAWSRPGALDGTCRLPMGLELPAEVAIRINFLDTLVHGWDLAKAIGVDPTLDPALATAGLEVAQATIREEFRGGRGFGNVVEVGAASSPTDRLVAFCGRRP